MSEESQMSDAQQLEHDRQAMSALAPKLRGLAAQINSGVDEAQARSSGAVSGFVDPGLAALLSFSEILASLGRAAATHISAMAGISELGAVAQTPGQVDALRARIESLPPVFSTKPDEVGNSAC